MENKDAEMSLKKLRKEIERLKKEYQGLSGEQRLNDEANKNLLGRIRELSVVYDQQSAILEDAANKKYKSLNQQMNASFETSKEFIGALKSSVKILEHNGILTEEAARTAAKLEGAINTINDIQEINNTLFAEGSIGRQLYDNISKRFIKNKVAETQSVTANSTAQAANATATTASATATTGASKAMRIFKVALASTGIGLLIIGLGELVANFDKIKNKLYDLFPELKKIEEFFGKVSAVVKGVAGDIKDLVVNHLVTFGKVVKSFFTGDFLGAYDAIKEGFNKFKNGVTNAITHSKDAWNNYKESVEEVKAVEATTNKKRVDNHVKTAKKIKEIHFDANAAILDNEKEFQKSFDELLKQEIENRQERYDLSKLELKQQLADGLLTREEYALKEEELTLDYLKREIQIRKGNKISTLDLENQLADLRLTIREREEEELKKKNAETEQNEASSQKKRLEQWKDYAEKVAEISQKISETTGMVTSSLGGMFGQLGSYYADQVQAFTDKIVVLDEEKEAALERVALSEEERQAKEEEIAMQKIELEYATSDEQRAKADERIAILQDELSAEDTINREFGDKKAELEKEKAKKEAERKKAEKMEKRLQMGQAIVEAIANVAAGAAKSLTMGPIIGPIMAAIVTAAGAVQVGIMTKQLSKMKDGGLLRGLSHTQGGMRIMGSNIEVEGGEYVVNKQSTSKNLGLLEYINGERRGLGYMDMNTYFGEAPVPPSFLSQMINESPVVPQLAVKDSVDTQILNAIERINFQPRVSVTDINTVHDNMVKVDEWTGL